MSARTAAQVHEGGEDARAAQARQMISYPPTPRGDVVDHYFGTAVADPYRWLEDIDSSQTRAWLDAQRTVTSDYLAGCAGRDTVAARLRRIADYARVGVPMHAGDTYVVARNSGLQNQAVLYTMRGERGEPRVLLDPNALSHDGTVALAATALSHDGRRLAYALQRSGSDWQTWHVRDVATGEDLPDTLAWAKFSGAAWSSDDAGFYYCAFDPPERPDRLDLASDFQKVYYHRIGTPQQADDLVYERPDEPHVYFVPETSDDGRYLFLLEMHGTDSRNGLVVRDLRTARDVRLFERGIASYVVVDNDGSRFFVRTSDGAPHGRLAAVDLDAPGTLADVVPESDATLEGVTSVGGRFFATYLRDAHAVVATFARDGTPLGDVPLPGIGSVYGFEGRANDDVTYFAFGSFTAPDTVYRYDLASRTATPYAVPTIAFASERYVTEQLFARSVDGTRVPVFVTRALDAPRDGSVPTILYGYGGFDISLTPAFSAAIACWLELGGSYAVANLRGGGEYGEHWHEAGMRERKQNVFDDFAAAAEALVADGYTSHARLALSGGSNGGLLCAVTLVQRPALARAVLCDVAVTDMFRYQHFTIGAAWTSEYGCAEASEPEFRTLRAYSPLENARSGVDYPATLITTGDHDDRVFPAHSFKLAATLQRAQAGAAPILLRVESDAGHGAGKPLAKVLDATADRFAFLARELGFDLL